MRKVREDLTPHNNPGRVRESLVIIYNYAGAASLQFWRSVFERRAPENLPRVEQVAPVPVGKGNTTAEVSDELLETLIDAYREAASSRIG